MDFGIGDIAQAGQFLSGLVSNTGSRMSDEHFREGIARSNLFLEGTTPTNAAMYNQYQDATYGADTQRQADRIKTMGKELGMSPWELTGNSTNTSPVQSFGEGKPQDTQFLSQQMPLKIAEMQSRTQLANTFLQNQTAEKLESMRQGIGDENAGGRVPKTLAGMQRFLAQGTAKEIQQRIDAGQTAVIRENLQFILNNLPKETINTGLYSEESKRGWRSIISTLGPAIGDQSTEAANAGLERALKAMPTDQFDAMRNDIVQLLGMAASGAKGVASLGKGISGAWDDAGRFLGNLTKKKKLHTGIIKRSEVGSLNIKP